MALGKVRLGGVRQVSRGTVRCGSVRSGLVRQVRWGSASRGEVRHGPAGIGQEAQGCANTRMFFITGAEGPLHIGDYHGY